MNKEQENKLRKEISRGSRAKELFEDPLLQEAFSLIRQDMHNVWQNSKIDDINAREEAYRLLGLMDKVEKHILHALETGKMASKMLEDAQTSNEHK